MERAFRFFQSERQPQKSKLQFGAQATTEGNIRRMSQQIFAEVRAGNISVEDATKFSNEMRNKIMFEHRKLTSAQGLAIVQKKEENWENTQRNPERKISNPVQQKLRTTF